jgi:hypothetical protein
MTGRPLTASAVVLVSLALSASFAGGCTSVESSKGRVTEAAVHVNDAIDASVRTAAQVHQAMRAAPAKGDSILAAAHLTAQQFEALMHRIASDSAMSADYKRLTQ